MSSLEKIVCEIKEAIVAAEEKLDAHGIEVSKVELEIHSSFSEDPSAAVDLNIGPIKIGGGATYSKKNVTKVKLSLVPEKSELELMSPVSDGLTNAIETIVKGIQFSAEQEPKFDLEEASAELSFTVSEKDEIKIIGIGASAESIEVHRLTLHFKPSK